MGESAAQALKSNGASSQRVGAIGFCMGGQLALYAGTVSPDVGAVVDFYNQRFGVGLSDDEKADLVAFLRTL